MYEMQTIAIHIITFHHSLSPCPGSSPKSPVSDLYQCSLSQVDNSILLLIDELDELDEFELDKVKFDDPALKRWTE